MEDPNEQYTYQEMQAFKKVSRILGINSSEDNLEQKEKPEKSTPASSSDIEAIIDFAIPDTRNGWKSLSK